VHAALKSTFSGLGVSSIIDS